MRLLMDVSLPWHNRQSFVFVSAGCGILMTKKPAFVTDPTTRSWCTDAEAESRRNTRRLS